MDSNQEDKQNEWLRRLDQDSNFFSEKVRKYLDEHKNLLENLIKHKQLHLLGHLNKLDEEGLNSFLFSLKEIDFDLMSMLYDELILHPKEKTGNTITPIQNKLTLKQFAESDIEQLRNRGLELISKGKVGIVLLSGGQGTRLGFEHPKGMYNIGMPSGKSLFEYFANKIARISQLAYHTYGENKDNLVWYLLTSEMNHHEITNYFAENKYFQLNPQNVKFFPQQSMPALDLNGRIILEEENKIHMSPNGNGGLFFSLYRHGILDDMKQRGIQYVNIFGVDNVLAKPADPFLLGVADKQGFDVTCKYVPKKHPEEKVGVHVLSNGVPSVVEYSEISKEMAHQVDDKGNLVFDASHIVYSIYDINFLEHILTKGLKELARQYHLAKKKIKYFDENTQQSVTPSDINGYKFELFIFDVLPLAKSEKFGMVEVRREEEFAPVKNAPGATDDSPDTARELVSNLHRSWLEKQGITFDEQAEKTNNCLFEIDFSQIYDENDHQLKTLAQKYTNERIKLPCFLKV